MFRIFEDSVRVVLSAKKSPKFTFTKRQYMSVCFFVCSRNMHAAVFSGPGPDLQGYEFPFVWVWGL